MQLRDQSGIRNPLKIPLSLRTSTPLNWTADSGRRETPLSRLGAIKLSLEEGPGAGDDVFDVAVRKLPAEFGFGAFV